MRKKRETPPEDYDPVALHVDPEIREIMTSGDLRLFSVTGHGEKLRDEILEVLAAQRDRLVLASGGKVTSRPGSSARQISGGLTKR